MQCVPTVQQGTEEGADSPRNPCRERFLIIAGVSKCGTTSLFNYLAHHPGIAPCRTKEPWMHPGIAFPCEADSRDPSFGEYLGLFPADGGERIRLEASTAYFSIPEVPRRIASALPNSKIIISFRDPIDRLASWHRFSVFHRQLPADLTFDDYVQRLMQARDMPDAPLIYRHPLELGRYSARAAHWISTLGSDRVLTMWFDDIVARPHETIQRVATFAGVDPDFFRDIRFEPHNPSLEESATALRDVFARTRAALQKRLPANSALRGLLHPWARQASRALDRLTLRPARKAQPKAATIKALTGYYRDDVLALGDAIGMAPPWAHRYARS